MIFEVFKSKLNYLVSGPFKQRQEALLSKRSTYKKNDFLDEFKDIEYGVEVANEVWGVLQAEIDVDGFKIMPDDELLRMFGMADEDLDELALMLLESCHCRIPPSSEEVSSFETIRGLVEFVASMKKTKNKGSGKGVGDKC